MNVWYGWSVGSESSVMCAEEGVGEEAADQDGSGMYCLPFKMMGRSEEEAEGVEDEVEVVVVVDEGDVATCAEEEGVLSC